MNLEDQDAPSKDAPSSKGRFYFTLKTKVDICFEVERHVYAEKTISL